MEILVFYVFLINLLILYFSDSIGENGLRAYKYFIKIRAFLKVSNNGQELVNMFGQIESTVKKGEKTLRTELPEYKYFTTLILKLLDLHKKLGIDVLEILPTIRLEIQRDLRFQHKLYQEELNSYWQIFIITFVSWTFIFFSSYTIKMAIQLNNLLIILIIQVSGFLIFIILKKILYLNMFKELSTLIEKFYLFYSLNDVGLSINKVLEISNIKAVGQLHKNQSKVYAQRVNNLIEYWQTLGQSPKNEVSEIIEDIWGHKQISFESFLKKLEIIKFIVLALFYLPAYFIHLFSIFKFFMEQ